MVRRLAAILAGATLALSLGSATVLAGQPNQSCEDSQPGPPGFDSVGFAKADLHYANPDSQGGTASGNDHVVSQYDVACYHFSQSHS
jgi:hypothetical protein